MTIISNLFSGYKSGNDLQKQLQSYFDKKACAWVAKNISDEDADEVKDLIFNTLNATAIHSFAKGDDKFIWAVSIEGFSTK